MHLTLFLLFAESPVMLVELRKTISIRILLVVFLPEQSMGNSVLLTPAKGFIDSLIIRQFFLGFGFCVLRIDDSCKSIIIQLQ